MNSALKTLGPYIAPAFIVSVTAWTIISYFVHRELEKRFP